MAGKIPYKYKDVAEIVEDLEMLKSCSPEYFTEGEVTFLRVTNGGKLEREDFNRKSTLLHRLFPNETPNIIMGDTKIGGFDGEDLWILDELLADVSLESIAEKLFDKQQEREAAAHTVALIRGVAVQHAGIRLPRDADRLLTLAEDLRAEFRAFEGKEVTTDTIRNTIKGVLARHKLESGQLVAEAQRAKVGAIMNTFIGALTEMVERDIAAHAKVVSEPSVVIPQPKPPASPTTPALPKTKAEDAFAGEQPEYPDDPAELRNHFESAVKETRGKVKRMQENLQEGKRGLMQGVIDTLNTITEVLAIKTEPIVIANSYVPQVMIAFSELAGQMPTLKQEDFVSEESSKEAFSDAFFDSFSQFGKDVAQHPLLTAAQRTGGMGGHAPTGVGGRRP